MVVLSILMVVSIACGVSIDTPTSSNANPTSPSTQAAAPASSTEQVTLPPSTEVVAVPTESVGPPTAAPPAATNELPACSTAGQTWISPVDGMETVCVPSGEFPIGSNSGFSDEQPVHTVALDAYWVDKYEVSNGQYQQCVGAGGCTKPQDTFSSTRSAYYGNEQYAGYPVIYVDWNQATAYCQWAGRQLPTEAQWEKAALGTDGRTYPWGEGIDCQKANYQGGAPGCLNDTSAVGSYPAGASPYGALDMAGNVGEWAADWYGPYGDAAVNNPTGPISGEERVLRGGSWQINENGIRSSIRRKLNPAEWSQDVGFRCASRATSP